MAFVRKGIDPQTQEWLRGLAGQVREKLFGESGCPEWGTRFEQIEEQGMRVGLELARLVMEQTVDVQAQRMPDAALAHEGDEVQSAGTETTPLITEAGPIKWDQPRTMLQQGRKAFFPPLPSAGAQSGRRTLTSPGQESDLFGDQAPLVSRCLRSAGRVVADQALSETRRAADRAGG